MKLVVFAASGRVGREIVTQAVSAGHDVTAVVRDPARSPAHVPGVQADLATARPASVALALRGADAVLSGLGPTTQDEGIAARGTRVIADAMALSGIRRLVVISAAPVATLASADRPDQHRPDSDDDVLTRLVLGPVVRRVFRRSYADLAAMEDLLRRSDLDWTVVRPPRLSDSPLTGVYRTAIGRNLRGGRTISRPDLAQFMLNVLDQPDAIRQPVGIAY